MTLNEMARDREHLDKLWAENDCRLDTKNEFRESSEQPLEPATPTYAARVRHAEPGAGVARLVVVGLVAMLRVEVEALRRPAPAGVSGQAWCRRCRYVWTPRVGGGYVPAVCPACVARRDAGDVALID